MPVFLPLSERVQKSFQLNRVICLREGFKRSLENSSTGTGSELHNSDLVKSDASMPYITIDPGGCGQFKNLPVCALVAMPCMYVPCTHVMHTWNTTLRGIRITLQLVVKCTRLVKLNKCSSVKCQ